MIAKKLYQATCYSNKALAELTSLHFSLSNALPLTPSLHAAIIPKHIQAPGGQHPTGPVLCQWLSESLICESYFFLIKKVYFKLECFKSLV